MIKKTDKFVQKDKLDTNITENSFTQAVKKAGSDVTATNNSEDEEGGAGDSQAISLETYDDLMRAKEAKNDSSVEGEKYRRDE